jgi:hypothetical protein
MQPLHSVSHAPSRRRPYRALGGSPIVFAILSERSDKFISGRLKTRRLTTTCTLEAPRGHTPHADFQDFRCSEGSGNPKDRQGVWVRRVDELSRATGAHTHSTCSSMHQVASNTSPSVMCRRIESATAVGHLTDLSTTRRPGRCGAGGFAGLSEGGRVACCRRQAARSTSDELTVLYSNGPDDRSVKLALGYVTAATCGC